MNTYKLGGGTKALNFTTKTQRFFFTRANNKRKARNEFWKKFKETHPAKVTTND